MVDQKRLGMHVKNIEELKEMAHPKTEYTKKDTYIESCIERDILYFEPSNRMGEINKLRMQVKKAEGVARRQQSKKSEL